MARRWWIVHRRTVLPLAIVLLSMLALLKLGIELHRLVADSGFLGAIDLRLRHNEVGRWFAGRPLYTELSRLTYPPQAYVMLWPFTGWLDLASARWLWALTSLAAIVWLCAVVVRESGTSDPLDRSLAVAMVVSMNAVGVTLGNGQLIVHLLPALLVALLLLRRPRGSWYDDAAVAILLQFALIKPTLSVPFAWVALVTTRRVRPLAFTAAGYLLLTLLAASFQAENAGSLLVQWFGQRGPDLRHGFGDVHSGLFAIGLGSWAFPASLLMLAALGMWTWRHRQADPWVLMGVAAIVARTWTYHRIYDDVLTLVPMVALFRMASGRVPGSDDLKAGVLLALTIAVMSVPARFLGGVDHWLFVSTHVAVWLALLLFLARAPGRRAAEREVLDS